MNDPSKHTLPTRFGFLLLDEFTLISTSCAIEALRMANRICGEPVYTWKLISMDGRSVQASDGISVKVDVAMDDPTLLNSMDAVFVCGGLEVRDKIQPPLLRWLQKADRKGLGLGATCTGSFVLASAGLLDGCRCSIHWENMASLAEEFTRVQVSRSIYSIDGRRYTSAGGTSPIDMMMYFIGRQCGSEVCAAVAEQFLRERIRPADDEQRIPLRHRLGQRSKKLVVAAELMEANIREPISQHELATYVGVSERQLQRLFQRYLGCSPTRYYLQTRLRRARDLLRQTSLNILEVATLSGFSSASHFGRRYREYFGCPPTMERQRATILPAGEAMRGSAMEVAGQAVTEIEPEEPSELSADGS